MPREKHGIQACLEKRRMQRRYMANRYSRLGQVTRRAGVTAAMRPEII